MNAVLAGIYYHCVVKRSSRGESLLLFYEGGTSHLGFDQPSTTVAVYATETVMSSSLVNSLAKVYDPNPLHGQKLGGRKPSPTGPDKSTPVPRPDSALHNVESRMDSLSSQMERMLSMQNNVLSRLDGLSQDLGGVGRDLASMRAEVRGGQGSEVVEVVCRELRGVVEEASERMECQGRRLEGVEKLMEGMQQMISLIGEVVKNSRLVELLFKEPGHRASKACRKVSVTVGVIVEEKVFRAT